MYAFYWSLMMLCVSTTLCRQVLSASLPTENIAESVDKIQKKFAAIAADKRIATNVKDSDDISKNKLIDEPDATPEINSVDTPPPHEGNRRDKMLDYYGFYGQYPAPLYPTPYSPYYPPFYQQPYPPPPPAYPSYYPSATSSDEYDDDYGSSNDVEEDDDGSRSNSRRRPSGGNQNSPIFYIRLPPTPYMFVPGMGYISQPPTIQPIAPQYALPPPPPPPPAMNPFINLPINYVSNAKPTGVYPWSPQPANYASPQFPSYLPPRPQRPYRPKPYAQDSKITHLKGSYIFNGRPEDIYLLPNPHYHAAYSSPYHRYVNPYQAPSPYQPPPPHYNPYSSLYAPPIPGYY